MASPNLSLTRRYLQTAKTLSEALPYMRQFTGKTFVIKYGGHAMGSDALMLNFARDVVLLKQVGIDPIVVHGGGPQISDMLKRLHIPSSFIDGLRVTDKAAVEVVEMVLSGTVNKEIVVAIGAAGGTAIGLSGKDGRLIEARKLTRTVRDPDSHAETVRDLGFVGDPVAINAKLLQSLAGLDAIPVIAPIGVGSGGETFNINADTVAGAIAAAMHASKLLLLTDVPGVLDQRGELIPTLTVEQARVCISDGTVSGGMIPKIETCIECVLHGAGAAHIIDGRVPHVLLLEIFTEQGIGTMLRAA